MRNVSNLNNQSKKILKPSHSSRVLKQEHNKQKDCQSKMSNAEIVLNVTCGLLSIGLGSLTALCVCKAIREGNVREQRYELLSLGAFLVAGEVMLGKV